MDDADLLEILVEAVHAVRQALDGLDDWGPSGLRPGQYRLDLAADAAAVALLTDAGLDVLSEESGSSGAGGGLLAVLDPVDGSTNAHRGLPYFATSICVLDDRGPRVGVVVDQVRGTCYEAVRGGGARRDGAPIAPSRCTDLSKAIVGISGFPKRYPGWAQFRALGAASLELCAVAEGSLDAYTVAGRSSLFGWDYLAGMLICHEAGAVVTSLRGEDLVVRTGSPRHPVAAASRELVDRLSDAGL